MKKLMTICFLGMSSIGFAGGTIGGSGTGLQLTLESQYITPKVFDDIATAVTENRAIIVNRIPASAMRIDMESRLIELQLATLKDPLLLETVEEDIEQ